MNKTKMLCLISLLLVGCQSQKFNPFPSECRTAEYEKYKDLYNAFDNGMVYAYSYVPYFSFLMDNDVPQPDFIYIFTGETRDGIQFVYNCEDSSEESRKYCDILKQKQIKGNPFVDLYGEPIIFEGDIEYVDPYYFEAHGEAIDANGNVKEITFNFYINPYGLIILDELSELEDVDTFSPGYQHTGINEPLDVTKEFTLDDKKLEYAWNGFSTQIPDYIPSNEPLFPID